MAVDVYVPPVERDRLVASCPDGVEQLVAAVNRIIDQRDITTVFQPLVDLATTEVVGYEAFTRGPAGSKVESPLALLEGAFLAGRLAEFDWMCAARACEAVLQARLHRSMTIFLNMRPATMLTACPQDLRPAVWRAQHNLRVVVDMDEQALTDDPGSLFDAVRAVREVGWGIAIDNVVADPAAMALLPLVRPDVLKLDFRSLRGRLSEVAKMGDGARAYSEQTGATVLAQGIEDQDDVWAARLAGATFGQGWLFGRPGRIPDEPGGPKSVFPLVQRPRVMDGSTPFDIITARCATAITEKRFLVALSRQLEEQVDTNGPQALLLETFEGDLGNDAETLVRLGQLGRRAAFLAVLGVDTSRVVLTGPTVRSGAYDPVDPISSEWNVIVLGSHYAAALTARPLDSPRSGPHRRFEYGVTHDRETIVAAAAALWARLPKRGEVPDLPG